MCYADVLYTRGKSRKSLYPVVPGYAHDQQEMLFSLSLYNTEKKKYDGEFLIFSAITDMFMMLRLL
jgi:hypothetical protein